MAGAVPAPHVARTTLRATALPGFRPTFVFTVAYLSLIVLIPIGALLLRVTGVGWRDFWAAISTSQALAAYRLSFGGAFAAAIVNAFTGLLVAWVLVRYRFPGRGLLDALVDLPLALPTAVAGIALTTLYAPRGVLGKVLAPLGIQVAFTPIGVILAMVFVGIPFVVRTIQPVLMQIDPQVEEAATVLGATRLQIFTRVLLPAVSPHLLTGGALAFARALGEYGSIVFISGNLPGRTEIVPYLIASKLEQYDYAGALSLAMVMLIGSFVMLAVVGWLQSWSRRRVGAKHG